MRTPTDRSELYVWHGKALQALRQGRVDNLKELAAAQLELVPPIFEDQPQCGYFKAKTSKGALHIPAKIFLLSVVDADGELVEPERLKCEIGDRDFDPYEVWPKLCARPIPVAEYRYLMALRDWAKTSAPDQPQAVDGRKVDWMTVQIPDVPTPQEPQPKRKR